MRRVLWCLRQLLPLLYVTTYTEGGRRMLAIWRMWFGRCFRVRTYRLAALVLVCLLATIAAPSMVTAQTEQPTADVTALEATVPVIPVELEPDTIAAAPAAPVTEELPAEWTAGDYAKLVAIKLLPTVVYIISGLLLTLSAIGIFYLRKHTGIVVTEKQLGVLQQLADVSWKSVEERMRAGVLKLPEGEKPDGAQKLEAALDMAEGLADEMGLKKMAREQLQKLIEAKLMEGRG